MVNEQPEALRLADELEKLVPFSLRRDLEPTLQAAAELRRLHKLLGISNALARVRYERIKILTDQRDELLEALQYLMVASGEQLTTAFEQAQEAIAKATGETK